MNRKGLVAAVLAALVILSLVSLPRTEAAVGSSSFTYIINGEETPVGIDPLVLKGGLVLPQILLNQIGITAQETGAGTIVLRRDEESITIKLGSKFATRNGERQLMATAPVRITGHLYVPDEALKSLGVRITNESGILIIDTSPLARASGMNASDYQQAKNAASQERVISVVKDTQVRVEVVRLNADIVRAPSWTTDSAVRGRTLELLQGSTLLQVTITNTSNRVNILPASSYYLVDNLGNQYNLSGDWIPLSGDLFGNLGPGSVTSGILVYSAPRAGTNTLNLYLQTSLQIETIGAFTW